jgi:ribosomal protein L11 methyltransferase
MYYTRLLVHCSPEFTELLMAEVADVGFDTFMEVEEGFEAYVTMENFDASQLEEIKNRYASQTTLTFTFDRIEKQNWNEEWEKSYQPIFVEDRCLIRAAFHQIEKQYEYEIIITPKMSFGTGHHQTTYLMIKNQLVMDHVGKRVMDAGCGTAILSIMAMKRGAQSVEAFDIDEWSVINGQENIEVNGCQQINLQQGKLTELDIKGTFDIILANINKNILLEEIKYYQTYLPIGGQLLLSGFYTHDIPDLLAEAKPFGLTEVTRDERENWAALLLQKIEA